MKQRLRILCGVVWTLTAGVVCASPIATPASSATPPEAIAVSHDSDSGLPKVVRAAIADVSAARISDHVNFLASDLLEGRGPGTHGGELAAAYIATQFALSGLAPAGDHGSYLQTFPLTGIVTLPQTHLSLDPTAGSPIPLKFGDDFLVTDETAESLGKVSAAIVFVGYGISAPALHHDDYAGADVKGKIALMFDGLPPADAEAPFDAAAGVQDYASPTYKFAEAAQQGAAGAILIHLDESARSSWTTLRDALGHGRDFLSNDGAQHLHAAGWIQDDVARVMFAASRMPLDQAIKAAGSADFKASLLPVTLNGQIYSEVRHFKVSNVVAMLAGSEPGTSRQVVMYTAHYDHLGTAVDGSGNRIYNGAVDNASGVGMLLELAHACANAPQRPLHPMLFVATAAGDQGQLGARYLSRHLPVRAHDLALMLNYDTVAPVGIPSSVFVSNARRSRFMPTIERLGNALDLTVDSGARSQPVGVGVAETLPFARVGIAAFSLNNGLKFVGHSREWGAEQQQDYRLLRYRQPGDSYRPEMNFDGNAKLVRYGLALGWAASSRAEPIRWKAGDAFNDHRHPLMPANSTSTTTPPPEPEHP